MREPAVLANRAKCSFNQPLLSTKNARKNIGLIQTHAGNERTPIDAVVRGAGCLHVRAKVNDDGMKFKQRDTDRCRKETENMRRSRKKSRLPQRCCRSRRSSA